MKRFYKKRNINYVIIIILIALFNIIVVLSTFLKNYSNNILFYSKIKIDEITKYYLNETIKNYLNIKSNDYIKTNLVNNNIVSVDIDSEKSNLLLNNIINSLQDNAKNIELGYINNYHNLELIKGENGIVLLVPLGVAFNNGVISNLGPKVPVKVNFFENINAYLDVVVESYGINNSLIKLYINIEITEFIELPLNKNDNKVKYKFLISSKLVNGEVPSILGSSIESSSNIVNSSVNQVKKVD